MNSENLTEPRSSFAAMYVVYDDTEWLECSVASIYSAIDAIYFFVSDVPWNGPPTGNQKTIECINNLHDPDGKIHLVEGHWPEEVDQRNQALAELIVDDFKYGLIIDADEIYNTNALKNMMQYAIERPEIECWHVVTTIYWKSPLYRIHPPEAYHPPVFLLLGTGGFVEYNNCLASSHDLIPPEIGFQHHMSYARSNEQIKRKINSFGHANQIREGWYEKVWMGWDDDHTITDLSPYNPGAFERTVDVSVEVLPEAVREYMAKNPHLFPDFE